MDWIRHSIFLIPVIPLIGSALNLLFGKKLGKPAVFGIACASVFASFLLSVAAVMHLASLPPADRSFTQLWYTWVHVGDFRANAAFLVDTLSAVMLLVVTGVGFLIHVYSIGYMGGDESAWRYFGYLNLFIFAMLTLVLADNFFLMFIGWEGVGLCSYLLIGFWYKDRKNTDAGKKAFIVNRIGDWAFLLGVLILFWQLGERSGVWTVTFTELRDSAFQLNGATLWGVSTATLVGILLFIGASGKSAQIPLYVWLPDAMAGPTPVSALIHAATMVTAGVYMIGRVHFIYDLSPVALSVVAAVGGLTAFFAATIGLVQNDIKKILAYSTVSQLGYMFLAMGVGAYSAGIFHLMTHAFFKACLFLGSGSVIMACHHEQDIRKMGGLRKFLPTTYWTFLASTLAIAGIFPLSGFFSKDEILWQAFSSPHGNRLLWGLGVGSALMTAFYMFRLVYVTFFGEYRGGASHGHDDHGHGHGHGGTPHESPRTMTVPLQILAVLAVVAGLLNVPQLLGGAVGWNNSNAFHQWLEPSLGPVEPGLSTRVAESHGGAEGGNVTLQEAVNAARSHATPPADPHAAETRAAEVHEHHDPGLELGLMAFSLFVALSGIAIAWWFYRRNPGLPARLQKRYAGAYALLLNKYYVDEIYQAVIVENFYRLMRFLAWFDATFVDGFVNLVGRSTVLWSWITGKFDNIVVDGWGVNGLAAGFLAWGRGLRQFQTGRIQSYLMYGLLGLLMIIVFRIL